MASWPYNLIAVWSDPLCRSRSAKSKPISKRWPVPGLELAVSSAVTRRLRPCSWSRSTSSCRTRRSFGCSRSRCGRLRWRPRAGHCDVADRLNRRVRAASSGQTATVAPLRPLAGAPVSPSVPAAGPVPASLSASWFWSCCISSSTCRSSAWRLLRAAFPGPSMPRRPNRPVQPHLDASSNRIGAGWASDLESATSLRRLQWAGYSSPRAFDSARFSNTRAHPIPSVTEPLQYRVIGLCAALTPQPTPSNSPVAPDRCPGGPPGNRRARSGVTLMRRHLPRSTPPWVVSQKP